MFFNFSYLNFLQSFVKGTPTLFLAIFLPSSCVRLLLIYTGYIMTHLKKQKNKISLLIHFVFMSPVPYWKALTSVLKLGIKAN